VRDRRATPPEPRPRPSPPTASAPTPSRSSRSSHRAPWAPSRSPRACSTRPLSPAADLDGDGVLDAVLPEAEGFVLLAFSHHVELLRGVGAGSFGESVVIGLDDTHALLPAGDLDANGRADVLVSRAGVDGALELYAQREHAGTPWTDLEGGLPGDRGLPLIAGTGTLLPGEPAAWVLHAGSGTVLLVLGAGELAAPFKGGTLFPQPDLVASVPVGGDGSTVLAVPAWPASASSATLVAQLWRSDASTPAGLAASNGLRAEMP